MAKYFRVDGTITRVEKSHYEVKYCNDDTDQIPMKDVAAYIKDYFIENNHESQSPVTLDQPIPKRKKKLSSTSSSKKPNKKRRLTQAGIDTASKTQRTTQNHGRSQKKMKNHIALSKPDAIDSKKKSQRKRRSNPRKEAEESEDEGSQTQALETNTEQNESQDNNSNNHDVNDEQGRPQKINGSNDSTKSVPSQRRSLLPYAIIGTTRSSYC